MEQIYLFDWGDTLMVDTPGIAGKMCDWEHVGTIKFAKEALKKISLEASIYIATAAVESSPEDILPCYKLGFNTVWLTSEQNKDVPEGVRIMASLSELCSK